MIIEEPNEYNKQQYEQAVPIPAKFLQMDGTITSHLGKTQEEATLKYKLYAWKLGIMSTTIGYLENENPEVGDVLMLPENTGSGKITDTNQLKKKGLITEVASNHIKVEIESGSEVMFERNNENDYEETITDIRGTSDISSTGLTVASKGTVFKAINIE